MCKQLHYSTRFSNSISGFFFHVSYMSPVFVASKSNFAIQNSWKQTCQRVLWPHSSATVLSWHIVPRLTGLFKRPLISGNTNKQPCRPAGEDKDWRGNTVHSFLRLWRELCWNKHLSATTMTTEVIQNKREKEIENSVWQSKRPHNSKQ